MQVKGSYLGKGTENRSTIHLGALVVPFSLFFVFGDPLLKLNSTLIIMGLLGNLFVGFIVPRVKGPRLQPKPSEPGSNTSESRHCAMGPKSM